MDLRHIVVLARRQAGFEGEIGHADDGIHRRADFVAHVGQENGLGFCRHFGPCPCLTQGLLHLLALLQVGLDGRGHGIEGGGQRMHFLHPLHIAHPPPVGLFRQRDRRPVHGVQRGEQVAPQVEVARNQHQHGTDQQQQGHHDPPLQLVAGGDQGFPGSPVNLRRQVGHGDGQISAQLQVARLMQQLVGERVLRLRLGNHLALDRIVEALRGGKGDLLDLLHLLGNTEQALQQGLFRRIETQPADPLGECRALSGRRRHIGPHAADHLFPIGRGHPLQGRLAAFADGQDIVVINQEAGIGGRHIGGNQPAEQVDLAPHLDHQFQRFLPVAGRLMGIVVG